MDSVKTVAFVCIPNKCMHKKIVDDDEDDKDEQDDEEEEGGREKVSSMFLLAKRDNLTNSSVECFQLSRQKQRMKERNRERERSSVGDITRPHRTLVAHHYSTYHVLSHIIWIPFFVFCSLCITVNNINININPRSHSYSLHYT